MIVNSFNEIQVQDHSGIYLFPKRKCKMCGAKYFSDDPSQKKMATEFTCTRCTVIFTQGDYTKWGAG